MDIKIVEIEEIDDGDVEVSFEATGITLDLTGKMRFSKQPFSVLERDGLKDFIREEIKSNVLYEHKEKSANIESL